VDEGGGWQHEVQNVHRVPQGALKKSLARLQYCIDLHCRSKGGQLIKCAITERQPK